MKRVYVDFNTERAGRVRIDASDLDQDFRPGLRVMICDATLEVEANLERGLSPWEWWARVDWATKRDLPVSLVPSILGKATASEVNSREVVALGLGDYRIGVPNTSASATEPPGLLTTILAEMQSPDAATRLAQAINKVLDNVGAEITWSEDDFVKRGLFVPVVNEVSGRGWTAEGSRMGTFMSRCASIPDAVDLSRQLNALLLREEPLA